MKGWGLEAGWTVYSLDTLSETLVVSTAPYTGVDTGNIFIYNKHRCVLQGCFIDLYTVHIYLLSQTLNITYFDLVQLCEGLNYIYP